MSTKPTTTELVAIARSRIAAMRIAPCGGLVSSQAAADEFERVIDRLVFMLPASRVFEFYETVLKVEERFRKIFNAEAVGNAKVESQMEGEQISTGWWVFLEQFGVAIRFGDTKPEGIDAGDQLSISISSRKKPAAPELAVVPPAPPPIDAETARRIWLDSLPPEQAAKVEEAIAVVSQGTLA